MTGLSPLYPILDVDAAARGGHGLEALIAAAAAFASLGLQVQQLRAKNLSAGAMLRLAERLAAVVPRLVVNDRADVAAILGLGVHLGQDDLPPAAARELVRGQIVGVSTHTPAQAAAALAAAPTYLALGPIFATASKLKPDPVVGVQSIRNLKPICPIPLVAIGGISLENCRAVWRAGADAAAVISALWSADLPPRAAEEFLLAFQAVSCHSPQD